MKKGFTLIELLAVIVILAIILAIAIPGITSIINSTKQNAYDSQTQFIVDAAKKYVAFYLDSIPLNTEKIITLKDLKDSNYIDSNITDSRTGELISDNTWIVVKNDNGVMKYLYGYETSGLILHYDGINNGGVNIHNDNNSADKGIWKDLSGNSNNGILNNINYDSNSGWIDNGIKLDGVNDYVISTNAVPNGIETVKTMEIVFKNVDSFPNSDGLLGIFTYNSNNSANYSYGISFSREGNVSGFGFTVRKINGTATQRLTYNTATSITLNTKYNASLTINSGNVKVYNDGNQIGDFSSIDATFNNNYVTVGSWASNYFGYLLKGEIYAVRIYDRTLTQEEIIHNYVVDKLRFDL